MKKLLSFSFILLFIFGCANDNNTKQLSTGSDNRLDPLKTDSADNSFFPVTSFLQGQSMLLDSMQVTFLQVTIKGNKTDSVWISRESIHPLLQPFFADFIDKQNLTPFFKESKFNDVSTAAITLSYDPKTTLPDSISIRHWDVYINPQTGTVKRIYILKRTRKNDSVYTRQLTWQTGKWAKMVTILDKPGSNSQIESDIKLQWDFTAP